MNKSFTFKRYILYLIVGIIGLILIILGSIPLIKDSKYHKNADKVVATVVNILDYPDANDENYEQRLKEYNENLKLYRELGYIKEDTRVAIIIEYEHNGKTITTELGYFSTEYKFFQDVNIYVNKNDSLDFIVEGRNQFGIIASMSLGGILVLSCLVLFLIGSHNTKCNERLLKEGNILEAEVLYVDKNERKESFGRNPNIFTCVYKDPETNKEEYFTSDSIFSKNEGTTYIGKKVKVYVDPKDPKNYYVDKDKFEKE